MASVLAAKIMPLAPMLVPPAAIACHECAAVPGTHVAVLRPAVGTVQLTSPTSVEPPASSRPNGRTSAADSSGSAASPSASAIRPANARSSASYRTPPTRVRFSWTARASVSLGRSG